MKEMPDPEIPGPGAEIRVLVADDSEAIRTRLALLVKHVPGVAEVTQAASAREVWEILFRVQPQMALVDVHLDDRGGGVLLQQIKKEFPGIALMALTRYAGAQFAATYRDCGADQCFDKTTELDALIRAVTRLAKSISNNEPREEHP